MPSRRRSRENALQMIYQWGLGGGSPEKVVGDFFGGLAGDGPRPVDPFAERLFLGVTEEVGELDAIIRRHSSRWSPERMSTIVRDLLRLALAELRWAKTPPQVVIDEALEIGKRFAGDEATAFLNGVLDAARREAETQHQTQRQEAT